MVEVKLQQSYFSIMSKGLGHRLLPVVCQQTTSFFLSSHKMYDSTFRVNFEHLEYVTFSSNFSAVIDTVQYLSAITFGKHLLSEWANDPVIK